MKNEFAAKRTRLVEYISGFAIKSAEVKNAFLEVKRENFVPEKFRRYAYEDEALPLRQGQTISQPSTIAIMLELLGVSKGMAVLEVGSGFGYVIALLSKIAGGEGKIFGVETLRELAEQCKKNLEKEEIKNAEILNADGYEGWPEKAPFDRILVSCACPFIPKKLFDQLNEGGRIVAPVGDEGTQMLEIMIKREGKPFKKTYYESTFVFVPMKSKEFRSFHQ